MFRKLAVQITERSVVNVYTDITCSIDDRLVIETKGGLVMAQGRLNMMFSPEESACERTSDPECSVDGKVLWPDKEFFKEMKRTRDTTSHVCKHCPMDPADCKTYEKRPCDTTETYSDFIEQEVSNERTKSNQSQ